MLGVMGWAAVRARHGAAVLAVVLLVGMLALAGCGAEQGTGETGAPASPSMLPGRLEEAGQHLDQAIAAAQAGDMLAVKVAYQDFSVIWMQIADPIWTRSRDSQIAIQHAIDNVDAELFQPGVTPDQDRTIQALQQLRQVVNEQALKLGS